MPWRWLALAAWCGFLFLYGSSTPFYRTEARRAAVGQSALDGRWLTPTLYGEPFLTKPPGIYVAIGLCSLPVGQVTEVTARLPSALAATLVVFLAFGTLRRFLGDTRAFVAAVLLPVNMQWLDKAPSAEIEMLHLASVAAALFYFLRAMDAEPGSAAARGYGLAAMGWVALGFLIKWPAPSFFYLTVVPFLAWERRLGWLFSREHLVGGILAVGLWAAWAALVRAEVGWDVLRDTVLREASIRFGSEGDRPGYPWAEAPLYPVRVLVANLPWAIPALFTLRPAFLRSLSDRERLLVRLLHCWVWPSLLFWTLPKMHVVRYAFPITPAITLLGVIAMLKWMDAVRPDRRRRFVVALVAMVVLSTALKVVFVEVVMPKRLANRPGKETGAGLAHLVPAGEPLYVWLLRDDQTLFYYRRPVRRADLATAIFDRPVYALLRDEEWRDRSFRGAGEHVAELVNDLREPVHLVRIVPGPSHHPK